MIDPHLRKEFYKIETTLRDAHHIMLEIYPDFNKVPNAERFIISCLKANEALRQMQRGNNKTVDRYWRAGE